MRHNRGTVTMSSKEFRNQVCHMGAGVTAGVVTTSVLHPLDLIKVRFQASDGVATNLPTYRNTADALRTIFVKERGRGLYQGLSPAVVGAGASWGLYFFFYERAKARYLRRERAAHPELANPQLSTVHHLLSAWEGGSITVLFTNPLWLVKTRMQLQVNQHHAGAVVVGAPAGASSAAASLPRRYPTMWGTLVDRQSGDSRVTRVARHGSVGSHMLACAQARSSGLRGTKGLVVCTVACCLRYFLPLMGRCRYRDVTVAGTSTCLCSCFPAHALVRSLECTRSSSN